MSVDHAGNFGSAPDEIVVEFLDPAGRSLTYSDLGNRFCEDFGIQTQADKDKPFKVSIPKKASKTGGNAYYEYNQQSVSLPDGLSTLLRVNGFLVPMGKKVKSKASGNLQRVGKLEIDLGSDPYKATAYITESKTPFYVNVAVIKKPNTKKNIEKAVKAPRGGSLIV